MIKTRSLKSRDTVPLNVIVMPFTCKNIYVKYITSIKVNNLETFCISEKVRQFYVNLLHCLFPSWITEWSFLSLAPFQACQNPSTLLTELWSCGHKCTLLLHICLRLSFTFQLLVEQSYGPVVTTLLLHDCLCLSLSLYLVVEQSSGPVTTTLSH